MPRGGFQCTLVTFLKSRKLVCQEARQHEDGCCTDRRRRVTKKTVVEICLSGDLQKSNYQEMLKIFK